MRKASAYTTARFNALRAFRRLEIIASPVLGVLSIVVIIALAWIALMILVPLMVTSYVLTLCYHAVRGELRPIT